MSRLYIYLIKVTYDDRTWIIRKRQQDFEDLCWWLQRTGAMYLKGDSIFGKNYRLNFYKERAGIDLDCTDPEVLLPFFLDFLQTRLEKYIDLGILKCQKYIE